MPRPARPWFRFYVEAVHDRKLRRLKPEHRWLFVACLAAARQSPRSGFLQIGIDDAMDEDDLADFAGLPRRVVAEGMSALQAVGIIEHDNDEGCWVVPSFGERQYESDNVTERTRKHRSKEREGNVPTSFPGTPPETETETEFSKSSLETPPPAPQPVDDDIRQEAKRRLALAGNITNPVAWLSAVEAGLRRDGWVRQVTPQSALPTAAEVVAAHAVPDSEVCPPPRRQGLKIEKEAS